MNGKLGLIHRDIKPDNILISNNKENSSIQHESPGGSADPLFNINLADFGLTCQIDDPKYIYNLCGTAGYVAPEILNSDGQFSFKADVFSVGAVIYSMLTGHNLFPGHSSQDILANNRAMDPTESIKRISSKYGMLCQDFL
jgi:serine/threonine protein kinase